MIDDFGLYLNLIRKVVRVELIYRRIREKYFNYGSFVETSLC